MEGKDVSGSEAVRDPKTGESVVSLSFDHAGAAAFAEATGRLTGQRIGIYMDETLISAPVVRQAITGWHSHDKRYEFPGGGKTAGGKNTCRRIAVFHENHQL